ncbi:SDR family NAD(P)-dependent oxidoreductase [Seongchinamella sediminis]|uniref:SDR family NAD(P)-dependent oxidoreductase n=1 Tax=Seongchinamella sediminis TaxID=2283635 RepID=A0A3L7E3D1_9GAMM|nr:SDR family NAD(P)-dependent oxidoreductase [Seongchinamella sediminis]RLQ22911.1 SDR family NAD(P)-dependent oxidoreductase [Seongchinamella sediminis]
MGELAGRVALVTGASRGIGRAIALRFAAEGAAVVVCASRLGAHGDMQGTLEETVDVIASAGGKVAALACNLADPEARSDLVARASEHFGPVDVLVNNAARADYELPSMNSTASRNRVFDLNVNVPVELLQQALPGMREKGGGWCLNISSRTAERVEPPYPDSKMAAHVIGPYGATKAALNRYTVALADELAEHDIFVNALAPNNIVLTNVGAAVEDIARRRPDMVEPIEMMAEAALELCTGRHVGEVAYSRNIIHATGRKLHDLSGTQVIGDAFTPAALDDR